MLIALDRKLARPADKQRGVTLSAIELDALISIDILEMVAKQRSKIM